MRNGCGVHTEEERVCRRRDGDSVGLLLLLFAAKIVVKNVSRGRTVEIYIRSRVKTN